MDSDIVIRNASSEDEENIKYILEHSRDATIFHTPEWNKLVSEEFGVPNKTIIAKADSTPVGIYTFFVDSKGLFKRIKSTLREADSIYGGPITTDNLKNKKEVIKKLVMQVKDRYVEYYRMYPPPDYDIELLKDLGYNCRKLFTSITKLEGSEEELWSKIDSKRRNLVRKAQANKIKIIPADLSFIDIYYEMLSELFKKVGKTPFPKSYYSSILQEFSQRGWVKFLVALHQGKPIAGAIFLCFKDTVYYWSGASFMEYRNLAPNDLIQWEIIKWARANQYKYYDLVMIERERLPGIAHFKLGFGGELVPIYEAIKRTPLGNLTRCIKALSNPRKTIRRVKKF
ncbi:GNAT family N-acetyltransferase [candidate division WOR-3 bacterium]|nr:GNAT family N-acetyltransferase [candidate division WOR-3 bacterium]